MTWRSDRFAHIDGRKPTDEDYGRREYGLRDLDGHDWYIATPSASPAS
jgi:hypothetical protein